MQKTLENIFFPDEGSFREWLEKNHKISPGIWIIFRKKHTKEPCVDYYSALDTALCFGWIDSIIMKIDESSYKRKFTPRSDKSNWSEFNLKRVRHLINNGKMTEAGLMKIDRNKKQSLADSSPVKTKIIKQPANIPGFIIKELEMNEPALTNFSNLASSYKNNYINWITRAKKEETRIKRLTEAVALLKNNLKLGLK